MDLFLLRYFVLPKPGMVRVSLGPASSSCWEKKTYKNQRRRRNKSCSQWTLTCHSYIYKIFSFSLAVFSSLSDAPNLHKTHIAQVRGYLIMDPKTRMLYSPSASTKCSFLSIISQLGSPVQTQEASRRSCQVGHQITQSMIQFGFAPTSRIC